MLARLRSHLTYANVVSSLCLFGLLGGGAYAVTTAKKNSVTSKSVKNDSLTGVDINESTLAVAGGPQGPKGDKGDTGVAGAAPPCQGNSPDDVMVAVGPTCVDRFEATIWTSRTGGSQITAAVPCDANGQDCDNIFARSVAGVQPTAEITYFQAQQALANSGKRLLTNAEWQAAVAGTPDSTTCNISGVGAVDTGASADCVSSHGVSDMIGNLGEWVADWDGENADGCASGGAGFGDDETCLGDASPDHFPGALIRGGSFGQDTAAGAFALDADTRPGNGAASVGFRGAR